MPKALLRSCVALGLVLVACHGQARPRAGPEPVSGAAQADAQKQSSGSLPWVVCGTKLASGVSGPVVYDATDKDVEIHQVSSGGLLYVQFSHDCNADVAFTIVPAGAATVLKGAPTAHPIAVMLNPSAEGFGVRFQRPSGPGLVDVRLEPGSLSVTHPPTTG